MRLSQHPRAVSFPMRPHRLWLLSAEQKEMRRLVSALVERSRRVFGVIWAALPEELRSQAAHIPQGCASMENDSVWELCAQWVALSQEDEDESFDAYRTCRSPIPIFSSWPSLMLELWKDR
jgi:hypothetical protein